jgi:hypothetical protein
MAALVHTDDVVRVDPGVTPPYDADNPLLRLLGLVEDTRLAAAREAYVYDSLQYLFPLTWLQLWGPSAPSSDVLDPAQQDAKTDFQKQNVKDFHLGDIRAVRGWGRPPRPPRGRRRACPVRPRRPLRHAAGPL